MKQSNSFEEAIKDVLGDLEEDTEIAEAMGSSTYMPAGLNAIAQNANRRSGNPPYSNFTDIGARSATPGDISMVQPDSEMKAPKISPFPLDHVVDEFLSDAYLKIKNVDTDIDVALKNAAITNAQIEELKKIKHSVSSVLGNIEAIAKKIKKITL